MTARRMVTLIGGQLQELPATDTFIGSPASNGVFKNVNFNANGSVDRTYVVEVGANIVATLPSPMPAGLRHTFRLLSVTGTSTLTISGNGNVINGAATLVVYAAGDVVELLSDGSDWFVVSEIIKPHQCVLSANVVQSIPATTSTNLVFQVENFTTMSAMRSGSGITILRTGLYTVNLSIRLLMDASTLIEMQIRVDGAATKLDVKSASVTGDYFSSFNTVMRLSAGQVVSGSIWHNNIGARVTTVGLPVNEPSLTITETR